jgi:hypothetical protein
VSILRPRYDFAAPDSLAALAKTRVWGPLDAQLRQLSLAYFRIILKAKSFANRTNRRVGPHGSHRRSGHGKVSSAYRMTQFQRVTAFAPHLRGAKDTPN